MKKRRTTSSTTPPRPSLAIFEMPGATLMQITRIDGGVRVGCPGCGATQEFQIVLDGGHRSATFAHERESCPVLQRIEEALRRYAQIEQSVLN
jgi:hypothetical protein